MNSQAGVVSPSFKAIQLDSATRQRTGRQIALTAQTRHGAVEELLTLLNSRPGEARIDPTRTLVQLGADLWTIVGAAPGPPSSDPSTLRRAGAKHRRVR